MPAKSMLAATRQRRRRPKQNAPPAADGSNSNDRYHLRVLTRALDVLEAFSEERPQLGLKEIAKLAGLPESSLFRILLTMQARGYLVQNRDGAYELPPKMLFGKLHERSERMCAAMRPYLESLAHRFDETASLAYLFGEHIKAIDTVETFHEIRITNKPGRVLPPHCSSLGKAITAFQENEFIERILESYGLYRRTEKTVIDRQALKLEFERIRARGYAVDREETTIGGICIGAPITANGAPVFAAVSVSTPLVRMTPERERAIIEAVRDTARQAALAPG